MRKQLSSGQLTGPVQLCTTNLEDMCHKVVSCLPKVKWMEVPHFQIRIEEDPKAMMDGRMDMVYVIRATLHEEPRVI